MNVGAARAKCSRIYNWPHLNPQTSSDFRNTVENKDERESNSCGHEGIKIPELSSSIHIHTQKCIWLNKSQISWMAQTTTPTTTDCRETFVTYFLSATKKKAKQDCGIPKFSYSHILALLHAISIVLRVNLTII